MFFTLYFYYLFINLTINIITKHKIKKYKEPLIYVIHLYIHKLKNIYRLQYFYINSVCDLFKVDLLKYLLQKNQS